MKRLLALILALALLLLPACGTEDPVLPTNPNAATTTEADGSTTSAPGTTEPTATTATVIYDEPATLSISCSKYERAELESAIARFRKIHPNIDFVIHAHEVDEKYRTQAAADIMAGGGDDLLFVAGLPFENYASKGMFVDLNPYIDSVPGLREDFYPFALESATVNDGTYLLLQGVTIPTLQISDAQYGSAINELFGDKIALSSRDLITAFDTLKPQYEDLRYVHDWFSISYVMLGGSDFYDYKTKYVNFGNEFIELVKAVQAYATPTAMYNNTAAPWCIFKGLLRSNDYNYGKLWVKDGTRQFAVESYGGSIYATPGTNDYAINANSENKDIAWEFLLYLYSVDGIITDYNPQWDVIPTRKSVLKSICTSDERFEQAELLLGMVERVTFDDRLYYEIIIPAEDDLEAGLITVEEFAQRLQDKYTIYVNQ